MVKQSKVFDDGKEHRVIEVGTDTHGNVFATETTSGAYTELCFECEEREVTLSFTPVVNYGLDDFLALLNRKDEDIFIGDFEDSLNLFGVMHDKHVVCR